MGLGEKWVVLERERWWREVMREGEKRDGGGEVVVVLTMTILLLLDLSRMLEIGNVSIYLCR